jgi:hypothetical protein
MPIQFHCKSCQGWIEVDDEHAGGRAICPFCQVVNGVPGEPRKPQPARPALEPGAGPTGQAPGVKDSYPGAPGEPSRTGAPEGSGGTPLEQQERERPRYGRPEGDFGLFGAGRAGPPPPPPPPRGNRLTRIGILGLAGAILSIVLMIGPVVIAFRHLPATLQKQILQSQDLTPEQVKDLQKKVMEELTNVAREKSWIERTVSVGVLLWVLSMVLNCSVVFSAGTHRRGCGWAGLMVNSVLLFLCLCSGIMQRFMGS